MTEGEIAFIAFYLGFILSGIGWLLLPQRFKQWFDKKRRP
jgi:hypothetical protein